MQVTLEHLPRDVLNYMFTNFFNPGEALPAYFIKLFHTLSYFSGKDFLLKEKKLCYRRSKWSMKKCITHAVKYSSITLLVWLIEKMKINVHRIGRYAIRFGSLDVLKWVYSRGYFVSYHEGEDAARDNQFEILKYLHSNNTCGGTPSRICYFAAQNGNLTMLTWIRDNIAEIREKVFTKSTAVCDGAAYGGHLEVLQWARKQNPPCPWGVGTCMRAAFSGHLEILQWLVGGQSDVICPWDSGTFSEAVRGGHIHIVKWIVNDNAVQCLLMPYTWISNGLILAAKYGHLDILKYLHNNTMGFGFDNDELCSTAAKNGHLSILKWLRSSDDKEPYPWDADVCEYAAARGDYDMLKWALDNGCEWNYPVARAAINNRHMNILMLLQCYDYPWTKECCSYAALCGNLDALKWLRSTQSCYCAVIIDNKIVMRGSDVKEVCPWDEQVCINAERSKQFDILRWAIENGAPVSCENKVRFLAILQTI